MIPNPHRMVIRQEGFSLVELMIGMVIALLGTIVIFQVFAFNENYKRTTTAAGDAQQSGSFSSYTLERTIRVAGSGMTRVNRLWGCPLNTWVRDAGTGTVTQTVPPPAGFPAAFNAIPPGLRLTPVLIVNGGSTGNPADPNGQLPDTLLVMAGQHDSLVMPLRSNGAPTATAVPLTNTIGINKEPAAPAALPKELLLAVDQDPGAGVPACRVAQAMDAPVTATGHVIKLVPNPVNLANGKYTGPNAFNGYSATVQLANLGAEPIFTAFAVGTDPSSNLQGLLSYNLIQGGAPTGIADNIVNLQAVYGVVADPTKPISDANPLSWKAPVGTWSAATLMNGTTASENNIKSIRAVRIAVVARNAQCERTAVSPVNQPSLFSDLGAGVRVDVTLDVSDADVCKKEDRYRYRTYDVSIPLRNMLLSTNS